MTHALNENIQNLRVSAGMSQVALAKELRVSKQCISNWENDNVQPSIEMLVKLADYFRVSTDFLLGRTQKETVDLSGLTEEQAAHIRLVVCDFAKLNR